MGTKKNKDVESYTEEEKDEAAGDDNGGVTEKSLEQKIKCERPIGLPPINFRGDKKGGRTDR